MPEAAQIVLNPCSLVATRVLSNQSGGVRYLHSVVFTGLAGPNGSVRTTELILGTVLFAPRYTSPAYVLSAAPRKTIFASRA